MLGVHKSSIRRMEDRGELRPIVVAGVHWFTREAVAHAYQRLEGTICAAAFRLFKAGLEPVDVVIELEADAELIGQLWRSYNDLEGHWVVEGPGSKRAWEPVFQLGELTPAKLRRALELCGSTPALRAELGLPPLAREAFHG